MQPNMSKSILPLICVALPMFVLDQVTKWLIATNLRSDYSGDVIVVIKGFFNIHHVKNSGAAFGFMSGQNVILILITIVAIGFIFLYYRHFRENLWMKIALGFLLGGALGNFSDRIRLGAVIDFLQFGIEKSKLWWPTFNVADISVCIGAGMLIVHLFLSQEDPNATEQIES